MKYPIKLAFDYSWENLARSLKRDIDFPKEICKNFLKDNFDVDINNSSFKLYADLLFIAENLATIEYNNPSNEKEIIDNIINTFQTINFEINGYKKKDYENHKTAILSLLEQGKNERDFKSNVFIEAKQKL